MLNRDCGCGNSGTDFSLTSPGEAQVDGAPAAITLARLGYPVFSGLYVAIEKYQQFNGLAITGELDVATSLHLESPRFCGFPDVMPEQLGESVCKWKTRDPSTGETPVTWTIVGLIPGFTRETLRAAYESAWTRWSAVCGLRPIWVDDASGAMVQMGSRLIDRSGGVLAESELPCGNARVCRQWYDTGESWVFSERPAQGQIDIGRVACHELGHALGLNHGPAGNLMAPMYSTTISRPQAWDIQEGHSRYGPPIVLPPLPPPPTFGEIVIKIRGSVIEIPGYTVIKNAI